MDFRSLLQQDFARRKGAQPGFSLRDFARALGVEASFLSKLLRGERAVTLRTMRLIGPKLGLSPEELDTRIEEVSRLKAALATKPEFNELPVEEIAPLAGWHYFAILELLTIERAKWTELAIAEALDLSLETIAQALVQLKARGLLKTDTKEALTPAHPNNRLAMRPYTLPELQRLQEEFLEKSRETIRRVPLDLRDHSGITMAIPVKRMDEAKKLIREFRRRFMRLLQRPGLRDEVYHLSVSFFPLTSSGDARSRETHANP